MKLTNFIFGAIPKSKPLLIALQGASHSGKTSFAHYLESSMKKMNINVLRIQSSSYFKDIKNHSKSEKNYDINNPAAINWDLMRKTFDDLKDKNETIQSCIFNHATCTSEPYLKQNTFPDVVILHGNFALNLFNEEIYNVVEYDCMQPSTQKIDLEYIKNPYDYSDDFNIFRVIFLIEKMEAFNIRSERIMERYYHDLVDDETRKNFKNGLYSHFCEKIWPSVVRWINYDCTPDFIIEDGHRNAHARVTVADEIFVWLDLLKIGSYRQRVLD